MWGWRTAERSVAPSVSLDRAQEILAELGFKARVVNPSHVILSKPGTSMTVQGKNFHIEAALAGTESGLFLQLRYDGFVLFDTGDLDELADDLAQRLRTRASPPNA